MNITFDQLIECIRASERTVRVLNEKGLEIVSIIDPDALVGELKDMQNNSGWTGGPK
jgi:hypothetical protein